MAYVMSAHQPNFLPYLGFFYKMERSDVFVIRDEVQFVESDFHHRNRIRIEDDRAGEMRSKWLTVPVRKEVADIKDIRVRQDTTVKRRTWHDDLEFQLRGVYERTPHFKEHIPVIGGILRGGHERLIDLNMELIKYLAGAFGIETPIVFASQLRGYAKTGDPSLDLLEISKITGATEYLSGAGAAKHYLDMRPFDAAGIGVRFQEFTHPVYEQRFPGFLPNMASIDALFAVGAYPRNTGAAGAQEQLTGAHRP